MGRSDIVDRPLSPAILHLQGTESPTHRPGHVRKRFVLCFDGTGNKFSGTDADSNILKIYRMLDRNVDDQFHYYQPGIGTYVTKANGCLTRTSRLEKCKHWYAKAKDSAVGTSFDQHVMAGYKFLMRYYNSGDDIFFFGFSRGAYTARFLAEMLDHVGLLSAGNEEMCHFAWKTFQKWQCRREGNEDERKKKRKLLEFMCAFRETFSRPVRPIRFLGLFDTVNSVPQFENAWMQRSKFPYTARSSAKVIRHAVAIDERRAKFRQDLISQAKPDRSMRYLHRKRRQLRETLHGNDEFNEKTDEHPDTLAPPERYTNRHDTHGVRSGSSIRSGSHRRSNSHQRTNSQVVSGATSVASYETTTQDHDQAAKEEKADQDILEVWFPGCHADIGGGWPLDRGADAALSHVPLVWMIREAQKAGLEFDEEKLEALNCGYELFEDDAFLKPNIPPIVVDPGSPLSNDAHSPPLEGHMNGTHGTNGLNTNGLSTNGHYPSNDASNANDPNLIKGLVTSNNIAPYHIHPPNTPFHIHLHNAAIRGRIHDVLQRHNGVSTLSVLSWNMMEYLPFRRMDLCADGSWKAITWPLPKGETRDMPADALVHCSVIRRMIADETYRPGNLIVGGGGRGTRHAPPEMGIGSWVVKREEGHAVGECFVRLEAPERSRTKDWTRAAVPPGGPQGNYFSGRHGE